MSKTVDSDVENCLYFVDLNIDPPLPDAKCQAIPDGQLTLRQIKDEDVQVIDGEIKVISRNITSVAANNGSTSYSRSYSYKDLKKELANITKAVKTSSSKINGMIIVQPEDEGEQGPVFRLKVTDGVIEVQEALLGWPDGTTTPFPAA